MSLDRQSALALGCFGKGLTETARVRGPTNAADVGVLLCKTDLRLAQGDVLRFANCLSGDKPHPIERSSHH
jgi:hypothetical protein